MNPTDAAAGDNDVKAGIMAVSSRIQTGRLKVSRLNCPNLIAEARLYRYPSAAEKAIHGENPIDENNHALGALRYLISRIDSRFIAKLRGKMTSDGPTEEEMQAQEREEERRRRRSWSASARASAPSSASIPTCGTTTTRGREASQ